jgi:cobalt-zinc-cadmium efflux system membrane fusion protein
MACQDKVEEISTKAHTSEHFALSLSDEKMTQNELGLVSPTEMEVFQSINCTGNIDVPPQNRASITAIMGGYVKRSPLLVGNQVSEGQVLLSLENPVYAELQQDYLDTKASLDYLKADYQRQAELQKEKINTTKAYQKAKSELARAEVKLKSLKERLSLLGIQAEQLTVDKISSEIQIYSPISGTIAMVNISRGTYVEPTEALMEILDTDHLHLELDVYEQDLMKVKVGQSIRFKLPEMSDAIWKGEVHLIGNRLDNKKRTIKLHGHLDHIDSLNLAVGMFVEAEIISHSQTHPGLPEAAVYEMNDHYYVFELADSGDGESHFNKREVKLLADKDQRMAVEAVDESPLEGKYLSGAYHFVGEQESGGHSH